MAPVDCSFLEDEAAEVLGACKERSATGPDGVPARVLKACANVLAKPLCELARRVLETGRWPEGWLQHWIVPLHKRGATHAAGNYRGAHLTSQLSKAAERLIGTRFKEPFSTGPDAFGPNQFAYSQGKGSRDALAYLVLS